MCFNKSDFFLLSNSSAIGDLRGEWYFWCRYHEDANKYYKDDNQI